MLCCLISKSGGETTIGDYQIGKADDSLQIRKMIGLVPDNVGLYDDLTAFENLDFYGKLYECPEGPRRERIERFLKMLNLWERKTPGPVLCGSSCHQQFVRTPETYLKKGEPSATEK